MWSALAGTFKISGNVLIPNSNNNDDMASLDAGASNVLITYNAVSRVNGVDRAAPACLVRVSDSTHSWLLNIDPFVFSQVEIYQNAGAGYVLKASGFYTLADNTPFTVTVTAHESFIAIGINDQFVVGYEAATVGQTNTKHGIRLSKGGSPAAGTSWDNFRISTDLPLIAFYNPHAGSVTDEMVVRAVVGSKVYASSHRAESPLTALGYEYTWLNGVRTEIESNSGAAKWLCVSDTAGGKIYAPGQATVSGTLRSIVTVIDTATDAVNSYVMNVAGHVTTDANELVGVLDDGTQLVVGERFGGGLSGGDYDNGGGLWTIPKATVSSPATYTRVYEDTASPTREWKNIVKRGSKYLAFLRTGTDAAYAIKSSTNLTAWSMEVDGSALSTLNTIFGSMMYNADADRVVAVTTNASRQLVLKTWDGAAWTTTTYTTITLPSLGNVWLEIVAYGDKALLFVSRGFGMGVNCSHDLYVVSGLGATPTLACQFVGAAGSIPHNNPVVSGTSVWYGTVYPGALMNLILFVPPPPPDARTYVVPRENRTLVVPPG